MNQIMRQTAFGNYDDEATEQRVLQTAAQYGIKSDRLQPLLDKFSEAKKHRMRREELKKKSEYEQQLQSQADAAALARVREQQQGLTTRAEIGAQA